MAWVYHWIQRYYLDGSRELQRLDSISKSPIFGAPTYFIHRASYAFD